MARQSSAVPGRMWILALAVLFAVSCSDLVATPIGKILSSPRDYDGKKVTVKGVVTETAGLLFVKYFVVKDDTGAITVVTNRMLPREGESVTVKGMVQEAFALGPQSLIVIVESKE